eukprot:TRINITY_DN31405_c0_g1_i1.p1 TRINITY_DN31405_c0_g1~~TRINITY_DN31405_c0_g1_i1.p1  ORF type:complete len:480 (+),score=86.33 TRINITY_DN31405_c0_g1_i1:84-1523(+)
MEDDERICRYCFEGEEEGPLIEPCKCAGGQRYVHLKCLRQWQRMVLVSQPTHPAFYDRDLRHQTCNVCKAEFNCPPPTRHELMASFTGPEIAALINPGCIIAANDAFSRELERQLEGMPRSMRRMSSYENWIRGVYLITAVEEAGAELVPIDNSSELMALRRRLGSSLTLSTQGQNYRLVAGGSLEGADPAELASALARLSAPCTLRLEPEEPPTCGDDHVVAVNLTRPMDEPPDRGLVRAALAEVCGRYKGASRVRITHFLGGPCEDEDLMWCVVLGGSGCGWTCIKKDLAKAIELAYGRSCKRCEAQGDIVGGQTVRLKGLQSCPELNGELGITLRFAEESGRWLVRLRNGEGKQLRPVNLEPEAGSEGRVFAVWGDARWSRAQLLGEIAKGDWGLCHANVGDLAALPSDRWANMQGRLAFAPITEMTESYMRAAHAEMIAARAQVQMQHADTMADTEEGGTPTNSGSQSQHREGGA